MIFHLFEDADGNWRWRLVTADESVLAECSVAYPRKEDCRAAIQLVKASRMAQVHEHRKSIHL